MFEVVALIIVVQGIAFAGLCGWLASQKHRNVSNWIMLGLFFGLIALLVLGFAPALSANGGSSQTGWRNNWLFLAALIWSVAVAIEFLYFLWEFFVLYGINMELVDRAIYLSRGAGAVLVTLCFLGLFVGRVPAQSFKYAALAAYLIPVLWLLPGQLWHLYMLRDWVDSSFIVIGLADELIRAMPAILLAVITLRRVQT